MPTWNHWDRFAAIIYVLYTVWAFGKQLTEITRLLIEIRQALWDIRAQR